MVRRLALCVLLVCSGAIVATASPAGAHDARIVAYLTGAAERPGPGDPDAVGRAHLTTNLAANRLCLVLEWTKVDGTLSGLHIHLAPPTSPGPIAVPFATPTGNTGRSLQCVTVAQTTLHNIADNPHRYYINLHSTPSYAGGAIRGQLRRI